MARPASNQLTERELEIMQVFWSAKEEDEELEVAAVQQALDASGRRLAHTTVATLIKILEDKRFLKRINDARPYRYRAVKSFEETSGKLLGDLIDKVFRGSSEALLLRLFENRRLSAKERRLLEQVIDREGKKK